MNWSQTDTSVIQLKPSNHQSFVSEMRVWQFKVKLKLSHSVKCGRRGRVISLRKWSVFGSTLHDDDDDDDNDDYQDDDDDNDDDIIGDDTLVLKWVRKHYS